MREITTTLWCDEHAGKAERVAATVTRTIALDNAASYEVDLCAECNDEIVGRLAKLVTTHGRAPDSTLSRVRPARVSQQEPTECPICDNGRLFFNKKSAVDHVWKVHVQLARPTQPKKCPDCEYPHESGVAMSRHRRVSHNYDPMTEALAMLNPPATPSRRRRQTSK